MGTRVVWGVVMAAMALSGAACGGSTPESGSSAGAAGQGQARVFFVRPKNGETIKTMSTIEFGVSGAGATVGAVPPGELTPAQVRPGIIHHHLGVDTDCLPVGVVIPKADPWIHFGDGKNVIEMQLAPGQHRLALQAGDDMHRTLAGMCEVITVTVVE
jgi:hypothetical protein